MGEPDVKHTIKAKIQDIKWLEIRQQLDGTTYEERKSPVTQVKNEELNWKHTKPIRGSRPSKPKKMCAVMK